MRYAPVQLNEDSKDMVSRNCEMPSTLRVQCPNCDANTQLSLRYTDGSTSDYEGVCDSRLKDGDPCGVSLLLTVEIP